MKYQLENNKGLEPIQCNTEKEANILIRQDPEFTNCRDLAKQSKYRVRVIAPYITKAILTRVEGEKNVFDRQTTGESLEDVLSAFNAAGARVYAGYNKCDLYLELSDGDKGKFQVYACSNANLFDQVEKAMPHIHYRKVVKPTGLDEAYVY